VKPVLAVLGGSTPFTAALVEALRAAAAQFPPCELRLFGQDGDALERMRRYGDRRMAPLGWTVTASRRVDETIDRAAVVVNQIRFGGLVGRSRDEAISNRFQLPGDETLGPCGLSAALRVVPRIQELAAQLGRGCSDGWVLNLSNPLSITTRAMVGAGAPVRCVGLCELPLVTVLETCRVLRMDFPHVEWEYVGLNHRGFISVLKHRGEDVLRRLPELLEGRTLFGVTGEEIRELGAIPLKYFRLSSGPTRATATHRAQFLHELKETIARELEQETAPPPSLRLRDLSWYEGAVVPMIAAIFASDGRRMIVNCLREDGLVWEVPARVWGDRVEVQISATEPPPRLARWLDRWAAHERALLQAVESPSLERIEHALALDPAVPASQVREIGRAIWAEHEK
jgi:6-phospho-beta-glucosidase